jgi:hypothetical protein
MAETVEHDVIPSLGQQHTASGKFYLETAADQEKNGRTLLISNPLRTPVPAGMDGPLDLYVVTVPGIIIRSEVPQQPTPVRWGIRLCVTNVNRLRHVRRR